MLTGESLKKIAEKTLIPKRNLIRWKHEYLYESKHKMMELEEYNESVEVQSHSTDLKKDVLETR